MSKVRLELTLTELHEVITESIRVALIAHRYTIAASITPHGDSYAVALPSDTIEATLRELGRNTAGALMLFAVDDGDETTKEGT